MKDSAPFVAIIGGGPAGLMAAEVLATGGARVELFDAMPSVGRKFLLAGVGGMNITHSEPLGPFLGRYGKRQEAITTLLEGFGAQALREWVHGLGIDTFVGSSGRVFPTAMKAAPLLRAWLKRLRERGVTLHTRHRWLGWDTGGALRFATEQGERLVTADACLLALGGGSWARLGSDGAWVPWLEARGIVISPLRPSNCGFDVACWSALLKEKFAGAPIKPVAIRLDDEAPRRGEFILTTTGVEGSLIYALSSTPRERLDTDGSVTLYLDLLPSHTPEKIIKALSKPRGSRSMAKHLHSQLGIDGARAALLHELSRREDFLDPIPLASLLKNLPLPLVKARPLDEAISSAGGVPFEALDRGLMLKAMPGVFCAGEMLDWEAPTGGYLLTACFASGRAAGLGLLRWLSARGGLA